MINYSWDLPYNSRRMPVLAENVVATSQPLAAQAGLRMLLKGGNAVDAALATAITLSIVEPTMNGLGSDAFALIWDGTKLHGLNASGRSPAAWSPQYFSDRDSMPQMGWDAVSVPGAVSAWVKLSERFGALPFSELFEPAIKYAADGYLVGPVTAQSWARAATVYKDFVAFGQHFLPEGRAPQPGERFSSKEQAHSLEAIAASNGKAFYQGKLATAMTADAKINGGAMTAEDLANHKADWVEPIGQDYRGYKLYEIPPNGQGLAALIALGILQHWDLAAYPVDSADSVHIQLEAMKLALADAYRYIADPASMDTGVNALLDPAYLQTRAAQIDLYKAQDPGPGEPVQSDTVYLTAADSSGMMVSFIQSNYMGFGSGVVVPGTGISLQNRASGFKLIDGHPNQVGGAKRPFHTIIPAFLTRDGKPLMSFGVMGGPMQAQGHTQMVIRLADYGQNPQAAVDAPRWQLMQGRNVGLEQGFRSEVIESLLSRGHVLLSNPRWTFGGAQLIQRLESGYCAASEPRKEGQAVGF